MKFIYCTIFKIIFYLSILSSIVAQISTVETVETSQESFISFTSISSRNDMSQDTPMINILMQNAMSDEFSPFIQEYSENYNVNFNIQTVNDDMDLYYKTLLEYFTKENSLSTKFDAFILPGLFLPNFYEHFEVISYHEEDDPDIYESLDYYHNYEQEGLAYTLSSEFYLLYYRKDIIKHELHTWEDLIDVIESNRGKDFNGDDVIDQPSCIPLLTSDNHQAHNYFYTILSTMLQTNGTKEGLFFLKDSFEPLVKNFGFQLALETVLATVNRDISNYDEARQKFLNGECIVLIDYSEFGKILTNYYNTTFSALNKTRASAINYFDKIAVKETPGSNNVYIRELDQIINCKNSDCTFSSRTVHNNAPFIQGGWVGAINLRAQPRTINTCKELFIYLSDSYQSSLEVSNSIFVTPYRYSHLISPSWTESLFNQLDGYTKAINNTLSNPNAAVDLRIPYNFEFINALEVPIIEYLDNSYIDPYQTSNTILVAWDLIVADVEKTLNIHELYILSYILDPLDLESTSLSSSNEDEDEHHSLLGLIIALPVAGGTSLCLLLTCIIFVLAFIAVSATRRSRRQMEDYQPAWAIDFDEIELKRKIGAGSFGDVYQGVYRGTNVAVKIPREKISDKDQFIKFFDEIAIMRDLRHPNVLLFMGARIQSPNQCIVTEYMPRGSLYDILHDESIVLDWMLIQTMALDAAQGMDFLHSASPPILHRDFKSPNLLVDKKWNLKVADFGLTKFQRNSVNAGNSKAVGSIFWTAPEVLRDPENYTKKSDVYSYGIVLWELLTRSDPYQGMNPLYVALAVMDDGLRPPIPPSWHGDIVELLNDCWSENPDLRPSFSQVLLLTYLIYYFTLFLNNE